jgi:hypothetical protein
MRTARLATSILLAFLGGCATRAPSLESGSGLRHGFLVDERGEARAITYEIRDGLAIHEGDIILGPAEDLDRSLGSKAYGIADGARRFNTGALWPEGGTLRIRFAGGLPAAQRDRFREAFRHYEDRTTLRFVEVATDAGDQILIDAEPGCLSAVGRQGGVQPLRAGDCTDLADVLHALGHAVGLRHEHEQPRPVVSSSWLDGGRGPKPEPEEATFGGWDGHSIMQRAVPWRSGSVDTVVLDDGDAMTVPGPPTLFAYELSAGDIKGIQLMYGNEFEPPASSVDAGDGKIEVYVRGFSGKYHRRTATPTGFEPADAFDELDDRLNFPYFQGQPTAVRTRLGTELFARDESGRAFARDMQHGVRGRWDELRGRLVGSQPTAVATGPDRLDLFARALDGELITIARIDGRWGSWRGLGTKIVGPVAAVSWASGRVDLFAVDRAHRIVHRAWNGADWGPEEDLGGLVVGRPVATTWGRDRLDVFVKGTNGAFFHKAWTGSSWSPAGTVWSELGGRFVGLPAVTSPARDRLEVFGHGLDGRLYQKTWNGSGWSDWISRGGALVGTPAVVGNAQGAIDVFVRGTDDGLWHQRFRGAWQPGFTDLGGTLRW